MSSDKFHTRLVYPGYYYEYQSDIRANLDGFGHSLGLTKITTGNLPELSFADTGPRMIDSRARAVWVILWKINVSELAV